MNSDTEKDCIIDLTNTSFESLDLSRESFTMIDSDALRNFTNLKHLDLSDNLIDKINKSSFDSLTSLETLNLRGNELEYVPDRLFSKMKSLKHLKICLEHLKPSSFDGLENLEVLELELLNKDKLEIHRLAAFKELISLKKFIFKWVDNEHYSDSFMEYDDLRENMSSDSNAKYLSKNRGDFVFLNGLKNLEHLSMSGLNQEFFRKNFFKHTPNLKVLHLEHNDISEFKQEFISGLKFLSELSLAYNDMDSIEPNVFKELPKLKILKLNNNKFEKITDESFECLKSLEVLDLSDNPIKSIEKSAFEKFKSLNEFIYNGNQLDVLKKSDLNEAVSVLQKVGQKVKEINVKSEQNSYKCQISSHFESIIQSVENSEKRQIKDFRSEEKAQELAKLKESFIARIKKVEQFNLNEFEKNQDEITSMISSLKNLKLKDEELKEKQIRELVKQDCWYICPFYLKKKSNKVKYPLGLLVVTDLKVSPNKLDIFK